MICLTSSVILEESLAVRMLFWKLIKLFWIRIATLGMFVRRCSLAFNLLTFEGVCHLLNSIGTYYKEALSSSNEVPQLDDSSNDLETLSEYKNMDLENFVFEKVTEEMEARQRAGGRVPFHLHAPKALVGLVEDIEVPVDPKLKYGDKLREGCHYAHPPSNTSRDLDPNGGLFLRTNWQVQGFLQEQADALERQGGSFSLNDFELMLRQLQNLAPELHHIYLGRQNVTVRTATATGQMATLETVARVKSKKNETKEEKHMLLLVHVRSFILNRSFQLHDVFNLDNDNGSEETPTLIDRKNNVFIISNFKSKYPVLQLDLRLISDLVVVIVSATCGGIAFACAGQPVISGYLVAGSVIGPGGFNFVSEMVQVENVAQFGVIFLLFSLGLQFSTTKLRVVRAVAVPGGLLQVFLFMCLCGITASIYFWIFLHDAEEGCV